MEKKINNKLQTFQYIALDNDSYGVFICTSIRERTQGQNSHRSFPLPNKIFLLKHQNFL